MSLLLLLQNLSTAFPAGSFPFLGILDDFNRADQTLNGEGIWNTGQVASTDGTLAISSQVATAPSGNTNVYSAFTIASYTFDPLGFVEIYATVTTGASTSVCYLYWFLSGENTTTPSGYWLTLGISGANVTRLDAGVSTRLTPTVSVPGRSRFGVRHRYDGTITVYLYDGSEWVGVATVIDSTYSAGRFGMGTPRVFHAPQAGSLDNLGGGNIFFTLLAGAGTGEFVELALPEFDPVLSHAAFDPALPQFEPVIQEFSPVHQGGT